MLMSSYEIFDHITFSYTSLTNQDYNLLLANPRVDLVGIIFASNDIHNFQFFAKIAILLFIDNKIDEKVIFVVYGQQKNEGLLHSSPSVMWVTWDYHL